MSSVLPDIYMVPSSVAEENICPPPQAATHKHPHILCPSPGSEEKPRMTAKCPKRSATTLGQSTRPSLVLLASPAGLFPLLRKDPETFQKLEAHVEQTPGEECRPLDVVPGHATDRVLDQSHVATVVNKCPF
ncbi:hypothetical protein ColLi_02708 [Colletotrichum liriopes]|uniref:Uncharacterized protein n=1 Tax=Colletotrichum liriopes TaxID=708192 RepID=A0AA37LP30_9PEZI|nr:hypothetical protein ColLi_02708 [Colletotrichum liriopes]